MSAQAGRNSPCLHAAPDLLDAEFLIKVDQVDWELHEEGVNCFAGNDPHPFSARKFFAAKKSF